MRIFRTGLVLVVVIALVAVAACQPDGRIDALGQRMDSLDQRLMAIEAVLYDLAEPAGIPDQRLAAAEAAIDALGERMGSLDQRLMAIEAVLDELVEPADIPDQRLAAAEANIDALGERMGSLDQRLMAIEAGMAALRSGETGELTTDNDLTGWEEVHVMEVTVGPKLLDYVGVGPRKCLEVNGQLFYEGIDGFKHEEGYTNRLKIKRYDAFPGEEEPPQDASRYRYRLIEVISKTGR